MKKTQKTQVNKAASIMGKKGGATRKKQLGIKGLREMGKRGGQKKASNKKLSTGK